MKKFLVLSQWRHRTHPDTVLFNMYDTLEEAMAEKSKSLNREPASRDKFIWLASCVVLSVKEVG